MAEQERTQGWQLEDGSAAAYERYLVPAFMDPWAADLVEAVDLQPAERILDVACGTGIVARRAAARVGPEGEVAGIDINPSMLSLARERAVGIDPPIRWKESDAAQLPFADASFDVVLCQQGLQFFGDRPAALAEMLRVVRPEGRLGLSTCRAIEHQPGYAVLADAVTRHVGVRAGTVIRSPYAVGEAEDLRALVGKAGFHDLHLRIAVWSVRFSSPETLLRAETASSPLGELVGQLDGEVQDALIDDLAAGLRPHTDDDGVVFPFETTVVTATR
jgi:ubiquinone/menaquinone biosynthesis C-methylase UbiE